MISRDGVMSRRNDVERLFSEDVDRILAGERSQLASIADDDQRTALEFAAKIVEMEPAVRAHFQVALQTRLRTRLAELEERSRTRQRAGWWGKLLHRPAWQAVAAVVVLAMAGLIVWVASLSQQQSTVVPTIIGVTADTTKPEYAQGENVGIEVHLKNVTEANFTIARFPPILSIMDSATGQPVYTSSPGQNTVVLTPGEETSFTVLWDQIDIHGQPTAQGQYYIEFEDIDNQGQPLELNLGKPVIFRID
jgi:hypothetical protein